MVYLLSLLKLQFNGGLDAVAGVLVSLLECQVHQVLVVRPSHVSTDENNDIGQNLYRKTRQTEQVLDECGWSHHGAPDKNDLMITGDSAQSFEGAETQNQLLAIHHASLGA